MSIDLAPVFNPVDVAAVVKPYLPQLSVEDEGEKIKLSVWDDRSRGFKLWILITKELGGLSLYIANEHTKCRRVYNLEELKEEIKAAAYNPVVEFRSLLGLKAQE